MPRLIRATARAVFPFAVFPEGAPKIGRQYTGLVRSRPSGARLPITFAGDSNFEIYLRERDAAFCAIVTAFAWASLANVCFLTAA